MTKDFHLSEQGNGGDLTVVSNDVVLVESLLQMAYLAMFGGNVEASTTGNELDTEERLDWWGNGLFQPQTPSKQFNSETERVLTNTVLNSSGRIEIERAVKKDLSFLSQVAQISVSVSIETHDRVGIRVVLMPYDNQQEKILELLFDNARDELIVEKEI